MNVGMVVAVEMAAVDELYGRATEVIDTHFQKIHKYEKNDINLYIINCGPGQIVAAASCQLLISEFDVEIILNFGVVGALTEDAGKKRLYIAKEVINYDYDTSEADDVEVGRHMGYQSRNIPLSKDLIEKARSIDESIPLAIAASGSKFVASRSEKEWINREFGADILDMELAALAIISDINHIPALSIKMVADSIDGGSEEFYKELKKSSMDALILLDKIIESL